jgi:integrase
MSRTVRKLTPERVKTKSRKLGLYGDGAGLYLRVTPPSACSWVVRYMLDGKAREMGIGSYPAVSLETARESAERWRKVKAEGRDPIAVREAERASERSHAAKAVTFRHCADSYIEAHRESWKNAKHVAQWGATLQTYVYPEMGALPVAEIDVGLVHKALEPIWKAKPETARRVRGRIEAILDWAKARGYRGGENPARWKGHLENLFPARAKVRSVEHHPALPYRELPAFMTKLAAEEGLGARALQFAILTAARTNEVILADWAEIDFDNAVWTVPAKRMKAKREHRVPLSKPALAVLREQVRTTGGKSYIFPGARPKRPLSNMAMLKTLERMGRDDITVHGFRSTFRDWVEESTNYAGTVAEAALAHVVGDKVEAAYRRGDLFEKRRRLMTAWATFCMTPIQKGQVIPIKTSAKS